MHSPNCPFVWQLFLFNNKTIIYRAFLPLKVKLRFVILCLVKIQGTLFYKCQDLAATRIATLVRIAGALFYEWDNVLFVHLVLLITLEGQTAASMRSLHLLNRSACQDLAATRIATLVRIAGALFYEWDNVLSILLVLLITLEGQTAASMRSLHLLCHFVPIVVIVRMGQRSLRSPCATHHLLCHFVPIVVIRSKKTTTYPKCLGVVVVFMQNKNHIDGSSMWSFFLLEYNQHRYTF
ncbi:hypothetical protein D3I14_05840 [Enterococcus faecalis]|nr:hypothetical protein [Enterococcus faecalis]KAJ85795.1 hypothetical protein P790_0082 [Enterococcus faecalis NJ44]KLL26001.1 hypothetical protein WA34_08930 [Streptococcus agalactiae]EGO8426969.1 hypothetical protein [Enterococcus faecalis]EGO8725273.1 hypothetical protein [Enterococcus faecalis]